MRKPTTKPKATPPEPAPVIHLKDDTRVAKLQAFFKSRGLGHLSMAEMIRQMIDEFAKPETITSAVHAAFVARGLDGLPSAAEVNMALNEWLRTEGLKSATHANVLPGA